MEPITREQWKVAVSSVRSLRGAKVVIDTANQLIDEKEKLNGSSSFILDISILQQTLDRLVNKQSSRFSYNTRLRYRRILQAISNCFVQQGIISQPPLLEISPQYEREVVARVRTLGQYRISDYRKVMNYLQRQFAGFGKTLIPTGLHEDIFCWLAVLLTAWGICGSKPISRLVLLEWSDVLFPPDHPVRWPNNHRRGYRWVYLPPICRLFFYCLSRQRNHSSARVFPQGNKKLARSIRHFLSRMCTECNVTDITLDMVGQLSQFEMLQDMSNFEVSVFSGIIRFSPVPEDQVASILEDRRISIDPTRYSSVPSSSINQKVLSQSIEESPQDLEFLLQAYDRYFSEVFSFLLELWQGSSPGVNRQNLSEWIEKNSEGNSDVAKFNVIWLLRWQLHLSSRKSFRLSSCRTYWIAALRVIHQFPGLRISEIGKEELVSIFSEISDGNQDGFNYCSTSRRLSRAAWQSLVYYLQSENLTLAPIDWKGIHIQREYRPVRMITDEDALKLMDYFRDSPEQPLIWLARRAGLRVSEDCKLCGFDLCLSNPPYLLIYRSKRRKSRKVDLSHMGERELVDLSKILDRACSLSSQSLFFDSENKPFDPHEISKSTIHALRKLGLRKNGESGQEVSFHDLRSSAASSFQVQKKDIRWTALQLGHSWVTTTEGYIHDADLSAYASMQNRSNPWNDPQMFIPLSTIGFLLGVTDRRMVQIVGLPNPDHAKQLLETGKIITDNQPPDGPRPKRRGKLPYFIKVIAVSDILYQYICSI